MKKQKKKIQAEVEIEFTPGYEQRFTIEILKIYEKRKRKEMELAQEAEKSFITA